MANRKNPAEGSGVGVSVTGKGLNKSAQVLTSNAHWSAGVPVRKRTVWRKMIPAVAVAGQLSIEASLGESYPKPDPKRRRRAFGSCLR
jgi:hypothetical protein